MSKGQMDLGSIYSYKGRLGYPAQSKMIILVHARGNYEFFFGRRALGKTATKSRTDYLISFENTGLVFMQVNRDGMFTGDNSFMPREKFTRIAVDQPSWIGGHYTSSQYNMKLYDLRNEPVEFTIYTIKSGIEWLEECSRTTIENLDYYMTETNSVSHAPVTNPTVDNVEAETAKVQVAEKPVDASAQPIKFCANCGNKLSPDDLFCQKCGTKVNN